MGVSQRAIGIPNSGPRLFTVNSDDANDGKAGKGKQLHKISIRADICMGMLCFSVRPNA